MFEAFESSMKISKQAARDGKALFAACKVNGVVDEGRVRDAVRRVLEGKPRGYLALLGYFQRLVKLDIDRRAAVVETAGEASAALQASVRDQLTRRYGAGLHLRFVSNPSLIGGIRVRVGSDIFDGSMSGRLEQLASSL